MKSKSKILIIEDEVDILIGLKSLLEEQYEVQVAEGSLAGLKILLKYKPDVVLLDFNMPDLDGLQFCKALRMDPEFNETPIIFLTAFNSSRDRTRAFELGADDYISKPFENDELLARINRKLKVKSGGLDGPSTTDITIGNLSLNPKTQDVRIGEKKVHLSPLEFRLLQILVESQGKVLSRKFIIDAVWQHEANSDRIVDPHIMTLRKKLKDFEHQIVSVYRSGYVIK